MPSQPADPERYMARPLGWGDWFVWDARRNEPVFGLDMLGEDQARDAAQRLSQAYRRAMSPVDPPPAYEPSSTGNTGAASAGRPDWPCGPLVFTAH